MIYKPYEYQRTAMRWIIEKPKCGLFLDMGLGKTVSTLTAVQQLIDDCEVSRVLVVAKKLRKPRGVRRLKNGNTCTTSEWLRFWERKNSGVWHCLRKPAFM